MLKLPGTSLISINNLNFGGAVRVHYLLTFTRVFAHVNIGLKRSNASFSFKPTKFDLGIRIQTRIRFGTNMLTGTTF